MRKVTSRSRGPVSAGEIYICGGLVETMGLRFYRVKVGAVRRVHMSAGGCKLGRVALKRSACEVPSAAAHC